MAREQYVATDKATEVEVAVTAEFPPHPDDRMRIARTTTLFTRLVSTLLKKEESERRMGFRAVETQLELADALIRQDMDEVRRLVRETMAAMGVTQDQLDDLARQLRDLGGMDQATAEQISKALGLDSDDAPEPGLPGFERSEETSPEDPPASAEADDVIDLPPPSSYVDDDEPDEPAADEADDEPAPSA